MSGKPQNLREGAERVARVLREANFEAFFAGGCVRDRLLGAEPKDYDVVTNAKPDQVSALFRRTIKVGASFGVVKVLLGPAFEYEVATFRKDGSYSDGRRPDQVVYSDSAEEDVRRRDFTINALLEDPESRAIIDHVGGRADLEAGLIRAVGDAALRVAEDRLRMLRAVRFAARLGFEIDQATMDAIKAHASEIVEVSSERITTELEGIWSCKRPELGLALLKESGLMPHVLPTIRGDEVALARLPALARDLESTRWVAWAVLFAGESKKDTEAEMRRLKMSREQIRMVQTLDDAYPVLTDPAAAPIAEVRRLLVSAEADVYRDFQRVLLGTDSAPVLFVDAVAADLAEHPLPDLPLVTGADLKALGMNPGPEFKSILDAVTLAVLKRDITTKAEGLALAEALRPTE